MENEAKKHKALVKFKKEWCVKGEDGRWHCKECAFYKQPYCCINIALSRYYGKINVDAIIESDYKKREK